MLYDGVALYVVDNTWLPRTNEEIAQLSGEAEMECECACRREGSRWTYTWPMVTSAGEMCVGVVDANKEERRAMSNGEPGGPLGGGDVQVLCARLTLKSDCH